MGVQTTMENGSKNYQKIHENFMKNHTGSNLLEIHSVVLTPFLVFSFKQIWLYVLFNQKSYSNKWPSKFAVEFLVIVVPQIAVFTVLSDYSYIIGAVVYAFILAIFVAAAWKGATFSKTRMEHVRRQFEAAQTAVTSFRASLFIVTTVCILAVDFPVFPRRFAKTETYGTSLMDTGVGMFVMTHAIVSAEARGLARNSAKDRIYSSFVSTLPMLVLGMARVIVLKVIGYHEINSEYGPHWNFFFTLAVIKILSTLIFCVFQPQSSLKLAIFSSVTYQILLTAFGLSSFLLEGGPRQSALDGCGHVINFIMENRGGIVSCFGFFSLYLFGVALGRLIFVNPSCAIPGVYILLRMLFVAAIALLLLLFGTSEFVEPVSRRLANLPYIITVLLLTVDGLFLLVTLDLCVVILNFDQWRAISKTVSGLKGDGATSLMAAVNRHGLPAFLLANLATGLVNLSIQTIYVPCLAATLILLVYTLFICSLCLLLEIINNRT